MVKFILRAEAAVALVAGVTVWMGNEGSLLWFAVLLLLPDLSMLGYAAGNRIGAVVYNVAHNVAVPVMALGAGWWSDSRALVLVGALLLAHVGMDRLFGYGLKLTSGFHDTHLGRIGRPEDPSARRADLADGLS